MTSAIKASKIKRPTPSATHASAKALGTREFLVSRAAIMQAMTAKMVKGHKANSVHAGKSNYSSWINPVPATVAFCE